MKGFVYLTGVETKDIKNFLSIMTIFDQNNVKIDKIFENHCNGAYRNEAFVSHA